MVSAGRGAGGHAALAAPAGAPSPPTGPRPGVAADRAAGGGRWPGPGGPAPTPTPSPSQPQSQRRARRSAAGDPLLENVATSGADGIQFDDPTNLPSDFGYDPFPLALDKRTTGRNAPADPQDLARLHQAVNAQQPDALFWVFPAYHDFAYQRQLQHCRAWVRRGVLEEQLVQLTQPELAESLARIPVAIALVTAQAEAARARGLGVACFDFETLWQRSGEPVEQRQQALGRLFVDPEPRLAVIELTRVD